MLTAMELRVVAAAARGLSVRETAEAFGRSVATVKQHRRKAIAKLGAHSMAHATAIAVAHGLIGGVEHGCPR